MIDGKTWMKPRTMAKSLMKSKNSNTAKRARMSKGINRKY